MIVMAEDTQPTAKIDIRGEVRSIDLMGGPNGTLNGPSYMQAYTELEGEVMMSEEGVRAPFEERGGGGELKEGKKE
jgi:hypothetical protein